MSGRHWRRAHVEKPDLVIGSSENLQRLSCRLRAGLVMRPIAAETKGWAAPCRQVGDGQSSRWPVRDEPRKYTGTLTRQRRMFAEEPHG